jgi:uroporphyrinogen-III decarboxylase
MTDAQWNTLQRVINGELIEPLPIGFIIDSPWLPNWHGSTILDYFTSDEVWLEANFKALRTFPDVIFLPGFWSEYGMCTEPSVFGSKSVFWRDEFPFAEKTIHSTDEIDAIKQPNPETDGLLPFMLNRLLRARPAIEDAGYKIRFSVSRGPLNVASFMMGTTELLTAMMMEPDKVHKLLRIITDFLKSWHELQRDSVPTIDGILMLDDIVGFVGELEFKEFGYPYLKELYEDADVHVKFFHNDADCTESVKYYPELGINLFNPGIHMSVSELKVATNNQLTILGSIPPRDVLSAGTPEDVIKAVNEMIDKLEDRTRLIVSAAGGMPPGVSTRNIEAVIRTVREKA